MSSVSGRRERWIRYEIEALGGEIHFHTKFSYDPVRDKDRKIILAIGHSARDSYEELYAAGLHMEAKDFAMGFRVQHPQAMIDEDLYGVVDAETRRALGPGAYKVTHTSAKNGRGVYSFCMCPGGYVVNSSSEPGRLCVNGMSYHARDGKNANAAIIVSIRKSDYDGAAHPLGGIALQSLLLGLQLLYHFQNFLDHAVLFSPFRSCRRRIFSNVSRISLRGTILSTKP